MLAGKVGEEKGVGKPLSQELEVQVLVLILCGAIYGRIREPPIAALGGRKVSKSNISLIGILCLTLGHISTGFPHG